MPDMHRHDARDKLVKGKCENADFDCSTNRPIRLKSLNSVSFKCSLLLPAVVCIGFHLYYKIGIVCCLVFVMMCGGGVFCNRKVQARPDNDDQE